MSNYVDLEKRRETQRRYREKNREKIREYYNAKYGAKYKRGWRKDNPEKSKAADDNSRKWTATRHKEYMREYYRKNKEKYAIDARRYYEGNKDGIILRSTEWRKSNKEAFEANRAKRRESLFAWWYEELLPSLKCEHCGFDDRDCLDFHHKEMKKPGERRKNPTTMLYGVCARKSIEAEIAKCLVLCANCHRKEHARLRRMQAER